MALAIGDALAMTVMEEKGLTAQDFAANHPAGRLGKRLTVTVGDLMHESPNVMADSGWLELFIQFRGTHSVPLTSLIQRTLIGIIADCDVRRR